MKLHNGVTKMEQYKQKLYIFDLDGCIANSDDFVLTNKEAYIKDPSIPDRLGPGFRGTLNKQVEDLFSEAYLADHQLEIEPYYGILDLFVRMSQTSNTAIITSRSPLMQVYTVEWLQKVICERYNKLIWRQLKYKLYFNEFNEKSLTYKKRMIEQLSEIYDIELIVDDHPDVADYAKSKHIVCLVPATGYKNLNGKDLSKSRKNKDDNMQKKSKRALSKV